MAYGRFAMIGVSGQERLTKQIATAISQAIQPAGAAVIIEARSLTLFESKFALLISTIIF